MGLQTIAAPFFFCIFDVEIILLSLENRSAHHISISFIFLPEGRSVLSFFSRHLFLPSRASVSGFADVSAKIT